MMTPSAIAIRRRTDAAPWYRQFWPWFIIALPLASVVFSVVTLVVAVRHADSLVRDDWYKAGLGVNRDLALERAAAQRRLHATLAPGPGELVVRVSGNDLDAGTQLVLVLSHPTDAARDLSLALRNTGDGIYRAPLSAALHGPWDAALTPAGGGWRLSARVDFDGPEPPWLGG